MNLIVEPPKPPKCKLVDNLRPPCSACGKPLMLTGGARHDLSVYCAAL